MNALRSLLILSPSLLAASARAAEIGYVEDFALASDRAAALKQLIPGTEDYYYYHCLHAQHNEQHQQVEALLAEWIKRHNYTPRVREILNRQALLTYPQNPEKSLEYLRQQLKLQFHHQRELLDAKPNLPTRFDEQLLQRATLLDRAFRQHQNTQGLEDAALDWLVDTPLTPERRRHLLERLKRPDHANLPQLVVDDLNHPNSGGFGSLAIHNLLLRDQLDACLQRKPELRDQGNFVAAYLNKLWPTADEDWQHDPAVHRAFLERLWGFVSQLAPVHNSLKAHVLYHRLAFDRSQGVHDPERFLAYVQLPRQVAYINREFLARPDNRQFVADLNGDFRSMTLLPPVLNDEPLVRDYLQHFFVDAADYRRFEPFVDDAYLKRLFAETKIVHGLGDAERWVAMLTPAEYQALKERIDLDFAADNRERFGADDPVAVDLDVKHVETLIVKVFEINTRTFLREHLREVNTDIDLDGLVPNWETTHRYTEPPLRRVRRHFEFPQLDKAGVYVIEWIGSGKSSRAVIRKGRLRHVERTTPAGHAFRVLDDQNRVLPDAGIWFGGRLYTPGDQGEILVPFSGVPNPRQPIVLERGDFCCLDQFAHKAEEYQLAASLYVDRESLLQRANAQLIVRPQLLLNGIPVSLTLLEDVRLVIVSTDHDGVSTTKEINDFALFEDREAVFEFQVPQRLAGLAVALRAKLQNLSQDKKVDLEVGQSYALNAIDRTDKVEDLHLARADGEYVLELRGRTGEPKADRPLQLVLQHRDFREPIQVSLQTDGDGRTLLGALPGVVSIQATGPAGESHSWALQPDRCSHYASRHGIAGQPLLVPCSGEVQQATREECSLLSLRGETFLADHFEAISLQDGLLQIAGLPAGDYDLWLKREDRHIRIRLTDGQQLLGRVVGPNRALEVRGAQPLQIAGVSVSDEAATVTLKNATPFARLHVFATRYFPAYAAFPNFASVRDAEPAWDVWTKRDSLFASGRNLGDEYRYIIERKYAARYPGNMLERPSLLLNPWAIRSTETGQQEAAVGETFAPAADAGIAGGGRGVGGMAAEAQQQDFANLDFLGTASAVLLNLKADEQGRVVIPRDQLGPHQHLHVVAVDPLTTVYRSLSLPFVPAEFADLRLASCLDRQRHFALKKLVTAVSPERPLVLEDITSSRVETYDTLAKVYALYGTLSKTPKLSEFGFVVEWPSLKPEEKRAKYSQYSCHELNYFLAKKDPEFFAAVVVPYLANKKEKQFLDHWLLGNDLSVYLQPWQHARLNVVERILLAQRIAADTAYTRQHVKDLYALLPPDLERADFLFETAVQGSVLDPADTLSLRAATAIAEQEVRAKSSVGLRLGLARQRADRLAEPAAAAAGAVPEAPAAPAPASTLELSHRMLELGELQRNAQDEAKQAEAESLGRADKALEKGSYFFEDMADARKAVKQFYRKLDRTQEWVENHYYQLPLEQQTPELITVNAFWRDYAVHDPASGLPFRSVHLAEASRNLPEVLFALAVLDLPFKAAEHQTTFDRARMTLTAGSPMVVYHEEIQPVEPAAAETPILVSENFFRHDDRYRIVDNERRDKFVTDEFLVGTVYGCQVVVTNPTSAPQKLDVLIQVPQGAIPVLNGRATRSLPISLEPFHTQTLEYHFYFPIAGQFPHYPVHVARNGQLLAHTEPFDFRVVDKLSQLDTESWDYVSQHGTEEQVLAFLERENLQRIALDRIAFRVQDPAFFDKVTDLLARRHAYDSTLWSYAIKHNRVAAIRQFLQHAAEFLGQCGAYLDSPLVTIDPIERRSYEQLDYRPLVNARAHTLGARRQILNDRFHAQYHRLLAILSCRRALDDAERMAVIYYLLLQDRVDEALGLFEQVHPDQLATRLQYDYFQAYLQFYRDDPAPARAIAKRYADYPVDRWREAFAAVLAQLDEIEGRGVSVVDGEDRNQKQTQLAAAEPGFDFQVEAKSITVDYQNLAEIRVNYYLMDIELLFSRNPFVQQYSGQFSSIRPNAVQQVALPAGQERFTFSLPEELLHRNILVEIAGGGKSQSRAYYANALAVQLIESYGQVRVAHAETRKPLAKVYVKVYAAMQDGTVRFYKDGYTDHRGRFDYTSLSTNELEAVQRFSLLVLSDEQGAVVREAQPPQR